MNRDLKEAGIVLKTTALRESDIIATILTRKYGKISAVFKSAKNSKKRFLGGIEIFDSGVFELSTPRGKSNLYTASGLSKRESFLKLREKLSKLTLASLAIEVTSHFCPEEDEHGGELFNPLFLCLRELDKAEDSEMEKCILQLYLLILLEVTGHDIREAEIDVGEELRALWGEMLAKKKILMPEDRRFCEEGLTRLREYAEEIVGKRMNSVG